MNARGLLELTKVRASIVKHAQREHDHVRLVAEQLHVSSTLARLDRLEAQLASLMDHLKLSFVRDRVDVQTGEWKP